MIPKEVFRNLKLVLQPKRRSSVEYYDPIYSYIWNVGDTFASSDHYHLLIYSPGAFKITDYKYDSCVPQKFFNKLGEEVEIDEKETDEKVPDFTRAIPKKLDHGTLYNINFNDIAYYNKHTPENCYISTKTLIMIEKLSKDIIFKKLFLSHDQKVSSFLQANSYLFLFAYSDKW